MKCPHLIELPPPPNGKVGWPWTEETAPQSTLKPGRGQLPRVTIVTPSFNQAEFLEETIRSLLLQGYPDLELIVMDGGSTDGSVNIIQKYQKWIAYWRSSPDNGQTSAINEGFRISTGKILNWINSDDLLLPGALFSIAAALQLDEPSWVIGATELIKGNGDFISELNCSEANLFSTLIWESSWFPQQATFWTKALWEAAGPLDESLNLVMDMELWIRMMRLAEPKLIPSCLSRYRIHASAKCSTQDTRMVSEMLKVRATYLLDCEFTKLDKKRLVHHHLKQSKYHFKYMRKNKLKREAARLAFSITGFLLKLIGTGDLRNFLMCANLLARKD